MGGSCASMSKVQRSKKKSLTRQNSTTSKLDSTEIMDKIRIFRKNIDKDDNDGMHKEDFVTES